MDRDASAPPNTPAEAVPLTSPDFVRLTGLIGVGLNAVAALLGVAVGLSGPPPEFLAPIQLLLVLVGVVATGAALSMRADLWWAWGLFGIAGLLGSVGLPASWDSFQLLLYALAGIGAAGVVLSSVSLKWRAVIVTAGVLFHFSGIFAATTSPPPQPWIVEQAWTRIYHPYLNFIYMRNAYHFYSPDPGPASLLAFFIKTETGTDADGKKQYSTRWIILPKRPDDVRDPLGLSYYRRLSLTEQTARPSNQGAADQFEKSEMWGRRSGAARTIPFHPVDSPVTQYRLPGTEVIRYVLPSYASHIILEETATPDEAARTTVKVYRLEHATTTAEQFRIKLPNGEYGSPYHPGTYRPYFMGEFDVHGNLIDPQSELLYWLVPIIPRVLPPGADSKEKGYFDYLSVHALGWTRDEVFKADESAGQVFPWNKMQHR